MTAANNRNGMRYLPRRGAGILACLVALTGCENVLDTNNPNNLLEDDLNRPEAARPIVNGAQATVAQAIGAMLGPYSTVTDEARWIGSRDAWRELDFGNLADPRNEFTDDAFRFVGQARWLADEAIRRVEAYDQARTLTDRSQLARAYLYSAIIYVTIGDMFDDFVLSDRRDPAPPIGEANMIQMYDRAIQYLDKALTIAQATTGTGDLQTQILGMRARAKYSRVVWQKLNPAGTVPSNPLVNDPGANADATAALARMNGDYRFQLTLTTDDIAYAGEVSLAYNLFQRRETEIGNTFGRAGSATQAIVVNLKDPITGADDPFVANEIAALKRAYVYMPITVVSAREMRLILAEAALAQGNSAEFTRQINMVRAFNNLTAYSGQVPALDLLKFSRQSSLFLQGRRLADMYRFGIRSPEWQTTPASTAVQRPGTFFPVTCIEIRSHPGDFPGVTC